MGENHHLKRKSVKLEIVIIMPYFSSALCHVHMIASARTPRCEETSSKRILVRRLRKQAIGDAASEIYEIFATDREDLAHRMTKTPPKEIMK